jgi:hypothetical protein
MSRTFIATIELFLRRPRLRGTFSNSYHHFRSSQLLSVALPFNKPTPGRFNLRVINFAPPGRGWFTIALRSLPLEIKNSSFKKSHLRKAGLVRMHPLLGEAGVGFSLERQNLFVD